MYSQVFLQRYKQALTLISSVRSGISAKTQGGNTDQQCTLRCFCKNTRRQHQNVTETGSPGRHCRRTGLPGSGFALLARLIPVSPVEPTQSCLCPSLSRSSVNTFRQMFLNTFLFPQTFSFSLTDLRYAHACSSVRSGPPYVCQSCTHARARVCVCVCVCARARVYTSMCV